MGWHKNVGRLHGVSTLVQVLPGCVMSITPQAGGVIGTSASCRAGYRCGHAGLLPLVCHFLHNTAVPIVWQCSEPKGWEAATELCCSPLCQEAFSKEIFFTLQMAFGYRLLQWHPENKTPAEGSRNKNLFSSFVA